MVVLAAVTFKLIPNDNIIAEQRFSTCCSATFINLSAIPNIAIAVVCGVLFNPGAVVGRIVDTRTRFTGNGTVFP